MSASKRPVTHQVLPVPDEGFFLVESGRSGETYRIDVDPLDHTQATCNCKAGKKLTLCSHVRAVRAWAVKPCYGWSAITV